MSKKKFKKVDTKINFIDLEHEILKKSCCALAVLPA